MTHLKLTPISQTPTVIVEAKTPVHFLLKNGRTLDVYHIVKGRVGINSFDPQYSAVDLYHYLNSQAQSFLKYELTNNTFLTFEDPLTHIRAEEIVSFSTSSNPIIYSTKLYIKHTVESGHYQPRVSIFHKHNWVETDTDAQSGYSLYTCTGCTHEHITYYPGALPKRGKLKL